MGRYAAERLRRQCGLRGVYAAFGVNPGRHVPFGRRAAAAAFTTPGLDRAVGTLQLQGSLNSFRLARSPAEEW